MDNCIFCKIAIGKIPSHKVYEDDHVLAFLDINPRAKGHTIVIPKVHAENLLDLNDELLPHFILGIKRSMERIEEKLHPEGYNVGLNHNEAGGQEIPHLHMHIFPRYLDDGGKNTHAIVNAPGGASAEEVAKLFT